MLISGSSLSRKFSKTFTFICSYRLEFCCIFRSGKFAIIAFKGNYMYYSDIKNKLSEVLYSVNTLCVEQYLFICLISFNT